MADLDGDRSEEKPAIPLPDRPITHIAGDGSLCVLVYDEQLGRLSGRKVVTDEDLIGRGFGGKNWKERG